MATQFGGFNLREHIEGISQTAANEIAANRIAPAQELEIYINNFEESLVQTQKMKEGVQERISKLQASLYKDEAGGLARDSVRLLTAFEREFALFEALEKRFDGIGGVAIRAGQQIERLGEERRRALEAKEIVTGFLEFCRSPEGAAGRLEAQVMAGSTEGRLASCNKLRRLLSLSKSMPSTNREALEAISGVAQRVEASLLDHFHVSLEASDFPAMKQSASLLVAFNGGQSCIQSFVNQHEFFLSPATPDMIRTKYSGGVPIDYSSPEEMDEAIKAVFREIIETIAGDWQYMEAVFQGPSGVMDTLLTRIIQEPVQVHLAEALRQAKVHSLHAYLRQLSVLVRATRGLADDIGRVYERLGIEGNVTRLADLGDALFSPYMDPSVLMEEEYKALSHVLQLAIAPLQATLRAKRAHRSTFFSSSSDAPAYPPPDYTTAAMLTFEGKPLVAPSEGDNGVPCIPVIQRCLMVHAEATARAFSLLPEHSQENALGKLFALLISAVCNDYLIAAIEGADSSTKEALLVAAACTKALAELQLYFQTSLLPVLVTASPSAYKHAVQAKSLAFSKVAEHINGFLHREVEGWMATVKSTLAKQSKYDFKPKSDDDLAALAGTSGTCQQVCSYLNGVISALLSCLDPENSKLVLTALGGSLHSALMKHIRSYTISETGGLLLRNDLRAYKETVGKMGPAGKALTPSFDLLCDLGNIFLMRPDNLRSYLQEGALAQLDSRLCGQFVASRADFRQAGLDRVFPEAEASGSGFSSFFAITASDL